MAFPLRVRLIDESLLFIVGILFACFMLTTCLYEDQVGKFDWRRQFIGIPKFVYHHPSTENLVIGTHSNVVASLHIRDGSILWRQLLPEKCNLDHMSMLKSSEEIRDYLVKTICLHDNANRTFIWNPQNGLLVSESQYKEFLDDDQAESQLADAGNHLGQHKTFEISGDSSLLVAQDGKVTYQVRDRIFWSREESLALVVAAEIVKLPINIRDSFGLKKMIVLVTKTGKFFGIDSFTGDVEWEIFDEDFATDDDTSNHVALIPAKQSDEEASESRAIVIHPKGLIMNLNPITGVLLEKKKLPRGIKQFALTKLDDHNNSRGVVILDTENFVHVYPETFVTQVKEDIDNYYITIADLKPPRLTGYKFTIELDLIVPKEVWSFPMNETETIVNLSIKRMDEEIHSPARVLGDRGILYKYVNPNLIAVMTEGSHGELCAPEQSINIYLIDSVTGALISNIHHQKSRGPSKMVHSENWLVYSYYNNKSRRTEVTSLEMFEGVHQVNSSAFSSLTRSHIKPKLIESKSFIFPSGIDAMADTVTLRGMTNRHIIVALPNGGLLEIPKIFLDPRRPINMLMEHREEGLIPYMPELPIPSESVLNYYQSLLGIRRIVTSPAILESTSLVFAYGLDLFFTRVTPSKTFDILKDDFDHVLIATVLVFLVVASIVSKYLAQRKALHAAWK